MRIDLGSKFRFLDAREVECPFIEEQRLVFRIARIGKRSYQEAIAEARRRTEQALAPTTGAFVDATAKANMMASVKGLRGKMAEDYAMKKTEELLAAAPPVNPSAATEAFFETLDDADPIAAHLIENISGLKDEDGQTVAYNKKVGIYLLTIDVPFGTEYQDGELELTEEMTLGQAIRLWVLHEAAKREDFRKGYKEAAEGN